MDEVSNSSNEQILKVINNFQYEMVKSMNYIREDVKDLKEDVKDLRVELKGEINDLRTELRDYKEENNRRWDENDKRWEENNRRWEENEKRWKQNEARWEKYEENRKSDRKFLLDTLTDYDFVISKQLGDPNAEKMRKVVQI